MSLNSLLSYVCVRRPIDRAVRASLALLGLLLLSGCHSLPKPGEPAYEQVVSAFYSGTVALKTSENNVAKAQLTRATKIAPNEPASWANLALFYMRNNANAQALDAINRAVQLKPDNSEIETIRAAYESHIGNAAGELSHLERAAQLDPNNVRARFSLLTAYKQRAAGGDEAKIREQCDAILKVLPDNLPILMEKAMSAANTNDAATVQSVLAQVTKVDQSFAPEARRYLDMAMASPARAVVYVRTANNLMLGSSLYKQHRSLISGGSGDIAEPIHHFIVLPEPPAVPAAPDAALTFAPTPIAGGAGKWLSARTITAAPELPDFMAAPFHVPASSEKEPSLLLASAEKTEVVMPGGKRISLKPAGSSSPFAPDKVVAFDASYRFRPDFVIADDGLTFYQQQPDFTLTDVTAKTKLPTAVLQGKYVGAWPIDYDEDGDLDLLAAPVSGEPVLLQNNGDGTWTPIKRFGGVSGLRAFLWNDLDGDGASDAVLLDSAGALHLFQNMRAGQFRPWPVPAVAGKTVAITVADIGHTGAIDLIALSDDGTVQRIRRAVEVDGSWQVETLAKWEGMAHDGSDRILVADLDNNGAQDLIATNSKGTKVWLADSAFHYTPLAAPTDVRSAVIDDTTQNGLLDLIGLDASGSAIRLVNHATKQYKWQDIRPRADFVQVEGDKLFTGSGRINSFGVGGTIELRAGLLYQKAPIAGPRVHFGLGTNGEPSACRIFWPSGTYQGEFAPDLKANLIMMAKQRLGGSCPWLFAWDGSAMKMVTDCIWRSPLGLKINAQVSPDVSQTEDWIKIRGDQLAPRNGRYDLSICAELCETHFFDYLELVAVDHPEGTEVFTDERFVARTPPPLQIFLTTVPTPVSHAVDDRGNDVTEIVRARDASYLDGFGRGKYQGVTRDHWVEITLPAEAPFDDDLLLIANGWIHPTDSSINVAISQGHNDPPRGIAMEIQDAAGRWVTAYPDLGFPEGKIKNVLLSMKGLFRKDGKAHQVRLRTNLEIYWDFIGWAKRLPDAGMHKVVIPAQSAELRYRGFSVSHSRNISSPELADYDQLSGSAPRWRDLEGFYTRYGEVAPLLRAIDDRYVIMNAGDELALHFPEAPAPAAGMKRDFVLKGDGWVKDGNFNTTFSRTVLPLPTHKNAHYAKEPTTYEADPVYRAHRKDFEEYHTRWESPEQFETAMAPERAQRSRYTDRESKTK